MLKRANNFDGFSYFISDPKDLHHVDPHAAILLEPVHRAFFENYPHSLKDLIQRAAELKQIPNLPKWLASLWGVPLQLELHTTGDLYDLDAVWLRFKVQEEDQPAGQLTWEPAINLLGFQNNARWPIPDLLRQIYDITGEINHNGYSVAGRLHHPSRIGEELTFYETIKNDKAFYQLPDLKIFYEFHGGFYQSEQERREYGLYWFDQGLPDFLNRYFGALLEKREFVLDSDHPATLASH